MTKPEPSAYKPENGYEVSTMFNVGNYCSNRDSIKRKILPIPGIESGTAEICVFVSGTNETVSNDILKVDAPAMSSDGFTFGWSSPEVFAAICVAVAALPKLAKTAPEGAKPIIMEPSHYVLCRGTNSMVKTADYFNEQKPTWGNDGWKSWKPVYVDIDDDPGLGIEAARELAAHMKPIDGGWRTLEPHLPDELALRPHNSVYQACRGKWRSPLA